MTTIEKIDAAWEGLRDAIDLTYSKQSNPELDGLLRGYARNISWSDDLDRLLDAEVKNERMHRRGAPSGFKAPISARAASKLLLCSAVLSGSNKKQEPSPFDILACRKTYVEAHAIGYLIKRNLTADWSITVESLDYSKIMAA